MRKKRANNAACALAQGSDRIEAIKLLTRRRQSNYTFLVFLVYHINIQHLKVFRNLLHSRLEKDRLQEEYDQLFADYDNLTRNYEELRVKFEKVGIFDFKSVRILYFKNTNSRLL